MGSRSRSSTSSTNTTENFTFNNVDNRIDDGGSGGLPGNTNFNLVDSKLSDVQITTTDLGAIDKAFEFSDTALNFAKSADNRGAETLDVVGKNAAILVAIAAAAWAATKIL
jgi:hypothetical protein